MRIEIVQYGKKILPVVVGAVAGYAYYYYYIGCLGASCPITGNPWSSTVYGAMIGALIVPWKKRRVADARDTEQTSNAPSE